MTQYFFSDQVFEKTIILPKEEAHHALKVLRKDTGDAIIVVDGKGGRYETVIKNSNIDECTLQIQNSHKEFGKTDHYIHIAMSPPKSHDRTEWFVEKAVELGIQEISFVFTNYSERHNIKLNRIKKRVISSMKQSLRAYLPRINDMLSINEFIESCMNSEKFIGYLGTENSSHLKNFVSLKGNYCVLIGPEGGFTIEEIELALKWGFQCISLGKSRLRAETAALAACHVLNIKNEE